MSYNVLDVKDKVIRSHCVCMLFARGFTYATTELVMVYVQNIT